MHIEQLALRARGEFVEMPGLTLTFRQAERLWGLDAPTCQAVIDLLVAKAVVRVQDGRVSGRL